MKKILIGAVLASTLAMSVDLAKCTEAIQTINRLVVSEKKAKNHYISFLTEMDLSTAKDHKDTSKAMVGYFKMFGHLQDEWHKVAKTECAGIRDKEIHAKHIP